jgi:hypothetical protein
MSLRRIANKERAAFRTGRNRVQAINSLKRLIRNMYLASLAATSPAVSNYQRRAATPVGFKPMSKANINRLLFKKNNKH